MTEFLNNLYKFACAVRADFDMNMYYRKKYQKDTNQNIPKMLIRNIGFQSLAAIRCMHFAADAFPLGGEVMSRCIRHLYGMEVHWKAKIAPGVSLVHGNGVVISHSASVGPGCIIFHNVTLGENRDSSTGITGAPTLDRNVHVGPGATILGPITIGEGSKVMAGATVTQSVPPFSLVMPSAPAVVSRLSREVKD